MSAAGRAYLSQVFGSLPYKAWAAANPLDARKISKAFNGDHYTQPGSHYARGLAGLCGENPPSDVPVPPPSSALAAIWQQDAVFTTHLSNFQDTKRNPAKAAGFRVVYVNLLHNDQYAQANEQEMPVFLAEGWTLVGWGTYGQESDPYTDGLEAANLTRRLTSLRGWKANGEAWAEGQSSWKTDAFLKGWRDGGGLVPLGWSVLSSDTANFPRNYAYDVALSVPGADIDIQVYGAAHPTYTVGAGLGMLSKVPVPVNRTTMSFDIADNGQGPFPDYRTWLGPRRVWVGERSTAETWAQLAR